MYPIIVQEKKRKYTFWNGVFDFIMICLTAGIWIPIMIAREIKNR